MEPASCVALYASCAVLGTSTKYILNSTRIALHGVKTRVVHVHTLPRLAQSSARLRSAPVECGLRGVEMASEAEAECRAVCLRKIVSTWGEACRSAMLLSTDAKWQSALEQRT